MVTISSEVNRKALKDSFTEACQNKEFKKLVKRLDVNEEVAMKYTSSLEDTIKELGNCKNCPGLPHCENRLNGHVMFPEAKEKQIIFSYAPCKYEKERQQKEANRMTKDKELAMASMKDIDLTDKKRVEVIKWLTNFVKNFDRNEFNKGLYLHGTFGC